MDPNDYAAIDPADAHDAHLNPGIIDQPEREEPPAPVVETPAPPAATKTDVDAIADALKESNNRIDAILREREGRPAPKADEPKPHRFESLFKDSDPEVRDLARAHVEL